MLSEEQKRYSEVLRLLSRSGLLMLILGFCVYITGLVPVITPIEEIPKLLQLRANEFIQVTGTPTGWNWLRSLGKGEVISNLGVIYLSLSTIICFFVILPIFIKKKEIAYTVIVSFEVIVLVLAACGVLNHFGGH